MSLPVPTNLPPPSSFAAGSSEWWIERLTRALMARIARFDRLESYYRGTQKLSHLAGAAWSESELRTMFPDYLHANHARLIVNATLHRLVVLGFRLPGELRADTEAARIWRRNDMDLESDKAHTEVLVKGECPILVEPNPRDPSTPIITAQDPRQMIVWHAPNDRRIRLAALKTWWDEDTRRRYYILYLPDRIERWRDREKNQMDWWLNSLFGRPTPSWERTASPETNPLGEVPVVVLTNDPRVTGSPEAEHEPVLSRIDHYNKTLLNMAITSHELAYPQRFATGVEADEGEQQVDPVTGAPIAPPRRAAQTGQTRWITTPTPDAQFGQFAAAQIDNYIKELNQIRAEIGTDTFTPYHFLLNMPSSVPASGDSITATETALTDKVRAHGRTKGATWRHAQRLAFLIQGDRARADAMLLGWTIWRDPERRTESQHVDALSKMAQSLGMPEEAGWEQLPIPPEEIDRWKAMRAEQPAAAAAITREQAEIVGALVRAGFDPTEALVQAGVQVAIRHTGLLPVTLQTGRTGAQVAAAALAGEELPPPADVESAAETLESAGIGA